MTHRLRTKIYTHAKLKFFFTNEKWTKSNSIFTRLHSDKTKENFEISSYEMGKLKYYEQKCSDPVRTQRHQNTTHAHLQMLTEQPPQPFSQTNTKHWNSPEILATFSTTSFPLPWTSHQCCHLERYENLFHGIAAFLK